MKLTNSFEFEPLAFHGLNFGRTETGDLVIKQSDKTIVIPQIYVDQFFVQVVKLSRSKPVITEERL